MDNIIDEESVKAAKAYEFSIAGIKLKLNGAFFALAIPILSTLGGASWGAFQFYNDYMIMKAKIEKYVTPDLSVLDKRISVLEENSAKQMEYTRDIKVDLMSDVRRLDDVVASVERLSKSDQRETYSSVRDVQGELRAIRKEIDDQIKGVESHLKENDKQIKENDKLTDARIKKALDNPLANK